MKPDVSNPLPDFDDFDRRAARPSAGATQHDPFGPQGNPFDAPAGPKDAPSSRPPLSNPAKDPFGDQGDPFGGLYPPAPATPDPFGAPVRAPNPFGSQPGFGAPSAAPFDSLLDLLPPGGSSMNRPSQDFSARDFSPREPSPGLPQMGLPQMGLPPMNPASAGLPPLARDPFGPPTSNLPPYSSPPMTSGYPATTFDQPAYAGAPAYSSAPAYGATPSFGTPRGPSEFDFGATPPANAPPEVSPVGAGKLKHSRDEQVEKAFEIAALNPLVAAAAPLLWLAARLHESMPPDDMRVFRDRVLDEVRLFETTAMAAGIAPRSVRIARYLLCANIDDILLNTSWGGQSNWAGAGLVSSLYSETIGGERFYDLLSQLYAAPDENVELLELIALCLSIGFVGKYRVMPGGQGQLNRMRSELYRTLRQIRGPYDRTLAPPWEIVAAPHRSPPRMLPLWLIVGAALAILIGVYVTFSIIVGNHLQAATDRLAALVPAVPVLVEKPPIPAIPQPRRPPPPPPPPVQQTQVERISALLKPDIAERRVEVVGSVDTVAVRLLGTSFPPSGAKLSEAEAPMMKRIATALDKEPGAIRIIGHTDNTSIGATSAFANNKELSEKRAESAAQMLKRSLTNPERVTSEGRGATSPIASNATTEGRAQNRRVEIEIPAEKPR